MEWYLFALKRYFDFKGRAGRSEYWYFALFNLLITAGLMIVDAVAGFEFFSSVYGIATLIPSISVIVRRLHDVDKSAWYLLLFLIPVIGGIIIIIYLARKSSDDNRYGPVPLGEPA